MYLAFDTGYSLLSAAAMTEMTKTGSGLYLACLKISTRPISIMDYFFLCFGGSSSIEKDEAAASMSP